MRDFARIQEQALSLDIFRLNHFLNAVELIFLWVRFVIIMKVKLLKH